jgi:hypothetical protein
MNACCQRKKKADRAVANRIDLLIRLVNLGKIGHQKLFHIIGQEMIGLSIVKVLSNNAATEIRT